MLGLQSNFAPRNDMASAVVFDGTNFVAVVEQFPEFDERAKVGESIIAQLYAVRFDPTSGRPLDAKFEEAPTDAWRDLRPYGRQNELHRPTSAIAVTREDFPSRHPALASLGNGKSLVVYSRHAGTQRTHIFTSVLEE
jgi:hypothetical protein